MDLTKRRDAVSDAEFEDEAAELIAPIAQMHGEDRIAAACRGSANPVALRWLAENLRLSGGQLVVDLGAGLGGPAAWMRAYVGCDVVAADPSAAAVVGARRLFGLDSVQAIASRSPFVAGSVDAVLLLGVLSVVDDRDAVVREARRIGRRVGVLDYCAWGEPMVCAGGSRFPSVEVLAGELESAWEHVHVRRVDEPTPRAWERAAARAQEGVDRPASEREVAAAIEAGRLVPYALVGE